VRSAERLSAAQARRVALAAQGFADRRPPASADLRHVRKAIGRVGVVQIDSVNVLCRAHELALWSRLGAYRRGVLDDLAHRRRELFEYWAHEASFVPVRLHPLLRWRMHHAADHAWASVARIQRDKPGYVAAVLDEVRARGPIAASDLGNGGASRGPWWGWAEGKVAMEWLFYSGQVSVHERRRSFERVYDLTERVLPAGVLAAPTPTTDDAHRALLLEAARAHGVATAHDLADYFRIGVAKARPRIAELVDAGALLPVEVAEWGAPAYLHPEARLPRRVDARAVLSPFDSLVWERSRTERTFGMRYRIEIYTPAAKRTHGYYVLPFLLGDQLVGRVDLKADRKADTLVVQSAWVEPVHADRWPEIAAELATELRDLAAFLELDQVATTGRGDLALPVPGWEP
jgi:uncharacterized protein YcaQ